MRKILYLLLLVGAAGILFSQCGGKQPKAKYVFYFIGDGMGVNQVIGTEMYLAEKEGRIGITPLNFSQFPVVNFATTYSEFNSVTCSAAAGTALATGYKTKNNTIGMDGVREQPLYSVAVKAKDAGRKVGVLTNVSIDHATPACFYAHQPDRNMYYQIGTDAAKAGFDFYGGSGFLKPVNTKDSTAVNLFTILQNSGYILAKGYADFNAKKGGAVKIIYMQDEGLEPKQLPFAVDRKEGDLTLAQLTEGAIDFLTKDNDKGFFVMVEGGLIDWACHSNDVATVFNEVVDLSDAVQKAYEFYLKHPDETLIVITADHETGGVALGRGPYELNLNVLENQTLSGVGLTKAFAQLRKDKNNEVSWDDVKQLLSDKLGFWKNVGISDKYEAALRACYNETFNGDPVVMAKSMYSEDEPIADLSIGILNKIALVGWTSDGHSAGAVPVFAIGAGSQLFSGKLDNTDIPKKIMEAAGY